MEFREVVERRRSTRAYTPEPVDPLALDRILSLMTRGPSAGNLQAYRIYVVRSAPQRRALAAAAGGQAFLAEAPVDLVVFADGERSAREYGERGAHLYAVQDATIASTLAALAATDEGLSSAWVGAFDEERVRDVCGEKRPRPVAIVPVGHGAEHPAPPSRRERGEIIQELEDPSDSASVRETQ